MKAGAKGKMSKELIEAMSRVVEDNILFATDEDLVEMMNDLLPEENRIGMDAFGKWKRGERQSDNELYPEFVRLIKKALFKEKKRLLRLLEQDKQAWQRYAWILERKFSEWNIKQKSEIEHTGNVAVTGIKMIVPDGTGA